MDLSIELKGTEALAKNSVTFKKRYPRTVLNAMRRAIRRDITKIKAALKALSGLGQTVWAKRRGSIPQQVSLIQARVADGGQSLITGVKLKGLARLIEEGGRTKAHQIKPRTAPKLAFKVAGNLVFARGVNHPGSPVRAHGIAGRIMANNTGPAVQREVYEATSKLITEIFSGRGSSGG